MAKIGTAHVEIKPVLNEDALNAVTSQIEAAVQVAVQAGLAGAPVHIPIRDHRRTEFTIDGPLDGKPVRACVRDVVVGGSGRVVAIIQDAASLARELTDELP